ARPTATSVTASLLAYADAEAVLELGTEPGKLARALPPVRLAKGEPLHLPVPGLAPDTQYHYRVRLKPAGGAAAASGTGAGAEPPAEVNGEFHTARPAGKPFTFTLQADSHLDGGTVRAVYERTLANVLADKPDFHLELGDTFMTDKYRTFRDAHRQYVAQRYYFGLACRSAPLFWVVGNHDGEGGWRDPRGADGIGEWSLAQRKRYLANPYPDGFYTGSPGADPATRRENYYAWTWGDALFVVLDPFAYTTAKPRSDADGWTWTLGKPQYDWLAATLAGSTARYKFVFLHHLVGGSLKEARGGAEAAPFFEWGGKGVDGADEFAARRPGWAAPIHALLVKANVSVVFHGHDHLYARQSLDGVAYVEVPQPSNPKGDNAARSARDYGYATGTILGSPGHVRVRIAAGGATVEYVRSAADDPSTNGRAEDSFVIPPKK
ncbi:MAG TPA: metallophosphoesterase, partial [Humisphaera sp.]